MIKFVPYVKTDLSIIIIIINITLLVMNVNHR